MAKLTVFFKDKAIHSSLFENGVVHIGRDESNDVTIDSLTVAPAHAVIIIGDNDCTIKQLNDEFPLIINGEETKTRILNDNDMISMGKHGVMFNTAEPVELKSFSQTANLQFMTGDNIGKILQLKKPMARLGRDGNGVVAISRRKDGYFVSVLENSGAITVNNEPLNDKALKLNTNDVLVIDNTSLQFFLN